MCIFKPPLTSAYAAFLRDLPASVTHFTLIIANYDGEALYLHSAEHATSSFHICTEIAAVCQRPGMQSVAFAGPYLCSDILPELFPPTLHLSLGIPNLACIGRDRRKVLDLIKRKQEELPNLSYFYP